ncbi:MAG: hypothetical protein H0W83_01035 [Planctomycetes bacterium]|nr:hypothetical protein [Planctomycetota bacterium]
MGRFRVLAMLVLSGTLAATDTASPAPRPTMGELMGLCTHTVQFRPPLYQPICRRARDYHPIDWDTGEDPATATTLPMARNRVDWMGVYRAWTASGFDVDACLMFDQMPPAAWKDPQAAARIYGEAFAKALGPSVKGPVASAEIGNEPGKYSDELYRALFTGMAQGLRAGDPKLLIATCASDAAASADYWKSLECIRGLESSYDVITLHTYAMAEGWPTWRPSFPEDPAIDYLARVRTALAWRDAHAPGKQVWITEFGWDAGTRTVKPQGDFAKWVDATEPEQARYLVRSFLLFAGMGIDRAYIFWFNDEDQPQLHGSKGLTRNWQPKPAFHAVAHLRRTLEHARFSRVVANRTGESLVYEFIDADVPSHLTWVAWSPTGSGRQAQELLPKPPGRVVGCERMPLAAGSAVTVPWQTQDGGVTVDFGEDPLYLSIQRE